MADAESGTAVVHRLGPGSPADGAPDYSPAAWPEALPLPAGLLVPALPLQTVQSVPRSDPALGRAAAEELSPERLLRAPSPRGLRGRRFPFGGGEQDERRRIDTIRTPLHGCHRITVIGRTDGESRTAVARALGSVLATHRADRVIAVGAVGPGGRPHQAPSAPLAELLAALPSLDSHQALRRFTSRTAAGLELLTDQGGPLDDPGYRKVIGLLSGQYPIVLTDAGAGPGRLPDALRTALELADQLVIAVDTSAADADFAAGTMDWLAAGRHGELLRGALTVVSAGRGTGRSVRPEDLALRLRPHCRAVLTLPAEGRSGSRLTEDGGFDLTAQRPRNRAVHLELAALIAEGFTTPPPTP